MKLSKLTDRAGLHLRLGTLLMECSKITRWSVAVGIFLLLAIPNQVSAYDVCENDGACTHEAMTRQALDIFFPDDADFPEALRREILFGAEDPDQYELFYGCGGVGDALVTCSHLWDADRSLGTPFVLAFKPYANAFQAAQTLWTRALGAYANGDVPKAYRYLGMVAHFLGDQTIPAHAHNDRHPAVTGDGDYYEVTMSQPKLPTDCLLKYPPGDERDDCIVKSSQRFTGGYNAELSITEAQALELKGILNPPETITETDRKFLWLLLSTNQVADLFPSDDFNGDAFSPNDPEFPAATGWIDDVIIQTYNELGSATIEKITDCNTDTVPRFENTELKEAAFEQDGKPITTCPDMFDLIREVSYKRGIRALAGLFALWQESIKQPILVVTMISMAELGEGDDDTGLVDGTNEDDFYVGMVFGTNKKVHEQDCGPKGTNYCEYLPASFLLDSDRVRRKVDGAFLASNTTRRDADPYLFEDGYSECLADLRDDMCFDAEGKDYIKPDYRFGQVYDPGADGIYDADDEVQFRVYGWDADAESPAEWLFDADDLLDINPTGGANILKFRVDLDKCFMNNGSGDNGVKVEGHAANDCGVAFDYGGTGGNTNDTRMYLSVRFKNILDDDNDGVPNIMDDCPNTPPPTQVNARGCPNTAPVATDDTFMVVEEGLLNGNVISGDNGNGVDGDADGDVMTINNFTQPAHGIMTISAAGDFSYEPNDNFCGMDSFTYAATDPFTPIPPAKVSNTATVSISVSCVNDPPFITDINPNMQEVDIGSGIMAVFITVEDVDDTATLLTAPNLSPDLARNLTLALVGCTVNVTESTDENGSTCVWVFSGRATNYLPSNEIGFIASDKDGPGSVSGLFSLKILAVPLPMLSNWALLLLTVLMLLGVGSRLRRGVQR
ncbi:MAG TPA: Ig-like domain-containing protein [Xanthomonadales bacterium]